MKIRPHLESLPPYTPIEPFEILSARIGREPSQIVKLDANENPYGILPAVREALATMDFPHIYPDPESRALRKSLAEFTDVDEEYLLAGSGADELLDLLMRVFLEPNECILSCPPTFGMYPFDAELNAARCIEVSRNADFSLNMDDIRKAVDEYKPKLLFIASPNNPDGSLIPADVLDELLSLPLLVVLDEAYIEFAGENLGASLSRIREVPQRENLIVLRTFSKWAGLAGLRIGYGAFPKWLMPTLWKSKQPYNVNVAASVAAQASLANVDELKVLVEKLKDERTRLFSALGAVPFLKPYPTQSNFILCQVNGRDAAELKAKLAQEFGVFIRYFNKPGLRDHIRISVGRPNDTDVLIEALGKFLTCNLQPVTCNQRRIMRISEVSRQTNETQIEIKLNLDGTGKHEISTGVGFLDHMLTHLAVHGLFDLTVKAQGDLHIDVHHTVEDVALALGQAFDKALGDRKGIVRMGDSFAPMDETLAHVAMDLSGRPYAVVQVEWHTPYVGNIPVTLFPHFFESFAVQARCNLHARVLYGRDDHHQTEALFKAWARALDASTQFDARRGGAIPSTKGTL